MRNLIKNPCYYLRYFLSKITLIYVSSFVLVFALLLSTHNYLRADMPEYECMDGAECGGDGFATQENKATKNVYCLKKIQVGIIPPTFTLESGYRDKCKGSGNGCTPTPCL